MEEFNKANNNLLIKNKEKETDNELLKAEHDKIKNAIKTNHELEMKLQKRETESFQREIN